MEQGTILHGVNERSCVIHKYMRALISNTYTYTDIHTHTHTHTHTFAHCRRRAICSGGAAVGRGICFGDDLFVWVLASRWAVIRGVSKQDCVSHDAENPPPQGPDPNSSALWLKTRCQTDTHAHTHTHTRTCARAHTHTLTDTQYQSMRYDCLLDGILTLALVSSRCDSSRWFNDNMISAD